MIHLLITVSKINDKHVDDAHDIDVVMAMCNLLEYSDNYSKTWVSSWQFYTHKPTLHDNKAIIDFPADNNNDISFKYDQATR